MTAELDAPLNDTMDGILTKIDTAIDPAERYAELVRRVSGSPDVYHLVCCDENTALCGEDVTDVQFRARRPDEFLCPLCKLAEDRDEPCPGCPDYRRGAAS